VAGQRPQAGAAGTAPLVSAGTGGKIVVRRGVVPGDTDEEVER
jgi:cytochrome oxidase assembly protein ShyY1